MKSLVLLLCTSLLGCGGYVDNLNTENTQISEVKANPNYFFDKDILIEGKVVDATKVLNFKLFKVQDNSGNIWVLTENSIPKEGQTIKIIASFDVLASFKEHTFGIYVQEKKRL